MSAIYLGTQRDPHKSTYRCDRCRKLMKGPKGQHGDRCPMCESGQLQVVARVTRSMILRAEAPWV